MRIDRRRVAQLCGRWIPEILNSMQSYGIGASVNLVSIDDPVPSNGQKDIAVPLTLKEAPIMDVNVELPFSVKSMDFQRWVFWITNEESNLLVEFPTLLFRLLSV
jgi:hypothetical protein